VKSRFAFPALAALTLLVPLVASAQAVPTVVAKDEIVRDNLLRFGPDVTVEGTVTGDVVVAASNVTINGTVEGDVLGFASEITVAGTVKGNLRVAAAAITVTGTVGRNVTVAGSRVELAKDSKVGGTVAAAGEQVDALGSVGKSVTAYATLVNLGGTIGGDARVLLTRNAQAALTVRADEGTSVAGNLHYRARQQVNIPDGVVKGAVTFDRIIGDTFQSSLAAAVAVGRVVRFAGVLLVGILLLWLLPHFLPAVVETMRRATGRSVLTGVIVLFAGPIAFVVLLITLVGIPLAVVLFVLYVLAIAMAKLFAGYWVGGMLAERFRWNLKPYAVLAIGFAVLELVLTVVPSLRLGGFEYALRVVTGIASLFVTAWVVGSLTLKAWRALRPEKPAPAA
jgi:hypothetical protein